MKLIPDWRQAWRMFSVQVAGLAIVWGALPVDPLDVGGLKIIPSATAAWVDVEFTGSAWVLTGYGTL